MSKEHILETTVGDLIVALTEETYLLVRDEQVAYRIVAYLLSNLLRNSEPITEQ